MNLSKVKSIFGKNKKVIILIIATFMMFTPEFSFAGEEFTKIYNFLSAILQFILLIFTALAGLLTMVISWFLSPEWTTGSLFGINSYLKELWILVSNVVYFIFAFILIWIAFMNILGRGDRWELKQALPKFIVGVLIVPFSWFFVQLIVSISSVLTLAVLTLPNDTFVNYTKGLSEPIMCEEYKVNFKHVSIKSDTTLEEAGTMSKEVFQCVGDKNLSVEKILTNNPLGIMNVYTYGIMTTDKKDDVTGENARTVVDIATLLEKSLFDAIFAAVYMLLLITLGLALLVRGIWLWLYMIFSPVFGLLYFFDKTDGIGSFDKFSIKEFITLALIPAYVAAALSFGLLFLSVVSKGIGNTTSGTGQDQMISFDFNDGEGNASITIGENTGGKIKLTMEGGGSDVSGKGQEIGKHILGAGKGMLGILIMQIFGLVVVWIAVMAALKASKITNTIVEPIASFGGSVGNLMMKAPTYAPILPGGKSVSELGAAGSTFKSTIEGHYSQKGANFGRAAGEKFVSGDKTAMAIEDAFRGVGRKDGKEIKEALETTLPKVDFNNINQIQKLVTALESVGFDKELKADQLLGKSKTKIAEELYRYQNKDVLPGQGFNNFTIYREMLETNLSQTSGYGDNKKIDRDERYYNDFSGNEAVSGIVKVQQEQNKIGEGSIILNRGGDKVIEYRLKIDTGKANSKFNDLSTSDKKEILDFYKDLTNEEKEGISDILKGIGLRGIEDNEALRTIIEKAISEEKK